MVKRIVYAVNLFCFIDLGLLLADCLGSRRDSRLCRIHVSLRPAAAREIFLSLLQRILLRLEVILQIFQFARQTAGALHDRIAVLIHSLLLFAVNLVIESLAGRLDRRLIGILIPSRIIIGHIRLISVVFAILVFKDFFQRIQILLVRLVAVLVRLVQLIILFFQRFQASQRLLFYQLLIIRCIVRGRIARRSPCDINIHILRPYVILAARRRQFVNIGCRQKLQCLQSRHAARIVSGQIEISLLPGSPGAEINTLVILIEAGFQRRIVVDRLHEVVDLHIFIDVEIHIVARSVAETDAAGSAETKLFQSRISCVTRISIRQTAAGHRRGLGQLLHRHLMGAVHIASHYLNGIGIGHHRFLL